MAAKNRRDMMRIFRALSVEKRVEIVRLLVERTLCVGALSRLLGISAGAVSQHLRILKDAGLVESDRRGYFIHYSLAPAAAARCRLVTDSLFGKITGLKKGGGKCAAEKRSAKSHKASKASRRPARRNR
ncbi:MAG: metalloregulator ArsR/SmtB family transcription factor [Phycisphaerae bacterium]